MKKKILDAIVSGALYDFMGFLASRNKVVTVSSKHTPYDIIEAYKEFTKMRNIDNSAAMVDTWDKISIGRYPTKKQKKRNRNV